MSSPVRVESHRIVDLPMGGSTLRLAVRPPDGDHTATLIIAHGLDRDAEFRRPAWAGRPITVSAEHIPAIREALAALEVEG